MSWSNISRVLELSYPIYLSLAVYWLFLFLDRKASGNAKRAMTDWIKRGRYHSWEGRFAVLYVFDFLYTSPLYRPQAIFRSALYSIATIIVWTTTTRGLDHGPIAMFSLIFSPFGWVMASGLCANLASDYVSLYIIRWLLDRQGLTLPVRLTLAFISSCTVVFGLYALAFLIANPEMREVYAVLEIIARSSIHGHQYTDQIISIAARIFPYLLWMGTLPAAMFVNIWLILFTVGAMGARFINLFGSAASFAQWFIKRGSDHPYEAIGMVAAAATFVTSMMYRMARSLA